MISFWAPGSPGSRVITQGSEEDSTIIDSSRSNEAAADTATVFKLVSCQRKGVVCGAITKTRSDCFHKLIVSVSIL